MDMDFLNSYPEAQMELMSMMIEMEKLNDMVEPPPSLDLSSGPLPPPLYNTNSTTPLLPSSSSFLAPSACTADNITSSPMLPTDLSFGESYASPVGHRHASMAAMREMIFRMAAMQPVHIDPESVKPPKRRNVRISKDPQSVAARHRRERISERIRILQRLVPGGTKMDTASMLDEAIHYVKFLKNQVQSLERAAATGRSVPGAGAGGGFVAGNVGYSCLGFMNPTQTMS